MTTGVAGTSSSALKGRRIVAGTDGSHASLLALEWAARQAELTDASLEVIAVWEWPNTCLLYTSPQLLGSEPWFQSAHELIDLLVARSLTQGRSAGLPR